jgi:transposase InsO family protein
LNGVWVPHETRDTVVDYVQYWKDRAELPATQILAWMKVPEGTFYSWKQRYGKVNEHNGWIPRDHWLEDWEKKAIIDFWAHHPLDGYRRLTYMMLDADVVAVSASSVYRVLGAAGLLERFNRKPSRKGKGFDQPPRPHRDWHIDVSYINVCGTFYFMTSILDGYSRYIVHWEIREKMEEIDIEAILQRARENFPGEKPRIISDNGPQFISRDFKQFIRICGMTHVRTSPYYPQSNGKLERYHRTIKSQCIRPGTPLSLDDARRIVTDFVGQYNDVRLHSAIGYVTPLDKLFGREKEIFAARDRKLEEARERRRQNRQHQAAADECYTGDAWTEDRALLGSNPSAAPGPEARTGGTEPPHLLAPTSLLASCEKPQGGWGTESPIPENTAVSSLSTR